MLESKTVLLFLLPVNTSPSITHFEQCRQSLDSHAGEPRGGTSCPCLWSQPTGFASRRQRVGEARDQWLHRCAVGRRSCPAQSCTPQKSLARQWGNITLPNWEHHCTWTNLQQCFHYSNGPEHTFDLVQWLGRILDNILPCLTWMWLFSKCHEFQLDKKCNTSPKRLCAMDISLCLKVSNKIPAKCMRPWKMYLTRK